MEESDGFFCKRTQDNLEEVIIYDIIYQTHTVKFTTWTLLSWTKESTIWFMSND